MQYIEKKVAYCASNTGNVPV